MKSLGQKIAQLEGLVGTADLNAWERGFVANVIASTANGKHTGTLTEKQIEVIERIHKKHFA